jgi:hypothetical protein
MKQRTRYQNAASILYDMFPFSHTHTQVSRTEISQPNHGETPELIDNKVSYLCLITSSFPFLTSLCPSQLDIIDS